MADKTTAAEVAVPATLASLPPRSRGLIRKAVDEAIGETDADTVLHALRWATKAYKQFKGSRKTPMAPGEDELSDKQRTAILNEMNVDSEWLEQNKGKLGFSK